MAKIKQAIRLGHRANLGEEVEEVTFGPGDEVAVLKEWADRLLCKDAEGRLFNIPKDLVER